MPQTWPGVDILEIDDISDVDVVLDDEELTPAPPPITGPGSFGYWKTIYNRHRPLVSGRNLGTRPQTWNA